MNNNLPDAQQTLESLIQEIRQCIDSGDVENPVLIGIMTGGLWVADRIVDAIRFSEATGSIDIGFHRDDHHQRSGLPQGGVVQPSRITHDLEGRDVILVDDVLHTGRTIRAALNHLFEYGRPHCVRLAVLLARSGRQLPIEPDFCGARLELPETTRIKLQGPDPLGWQWSEPNGR